MAETSSTSSSAVVSTLALNAAICGVFVTCFLVLRLKFKRIYSPKASYDLIREEQKPEPLPKDPFSWIYILLRRPHSFILRQAGLDGYFFLRYILVMACLFLGGLLTFTVLLPINVANGNGQEGLDQLSISNVKHHTRYYAHVFVGWAFYGVTMFVFWRELYFFNSLRCAVMALPRYAAKRSSRTVLFQSVPDELLDEKQLYKMFNGIKRIYVVRTSRKLAARVKERVLVVNRLESCENKLLRMAVKEKLKRDKKATKNGEPLPPVTDDIYEYVPENKRPHHKVKHKKVDTIEWCKERIPELNKEIKYMQKHFKQNRPQNSLFVEFKGQYYAQMALQQITTHNPMRLNPSYTGYEPGNILWTNMRLFWWERIFRRSVAAAVIGALIILWAIPVAFVGLISNITYLTDKLHWLRWIYKLPSQLLGLITGLLPTVMLSLLFLILPMIIRSMAKVAGNPLAQSVELFTQQAYFGFQIFNGFIVLTLASSATAAVVEVLEEPLKVLPILAQGFPKASNFFISYIILQGLGVAGGSLFQVVGLLSYYALGYLLDRTVRKKWARFSGLGSMAWGTTFPVFTMLASITLAYAIISPMILLFATVAFFLVYITYLYNLTYVFRESAETRGMHYPRAIFQSFTGIYLGQVCMLGIFAVGKGWGPIILQVIGICATVFFHINLNQAFDHLLKYVPLDCMRALDGVSDTISQRGATSEYKEKVLDKFSAREYRDEESSEWAAEETKVELGKVPLMADRTFKKTRHDNFLVRFLRPDVFASYLAVKAILPDFYLVEDEADLVDDKHAFYSPDIGAQCPNVWIPRDPMGCSLIEVENLKKILTVSDENSGFDKNGNIIYTDKPPF